MHGKFSYRLAVYLFNILPHPFPFLLCALCETTHIGFFQKVGSRLLGKDSTDILYIPVYIGKDGC